ncbi:MAG TPA: RtcB family protein [Reyranella sp.]|jgi:tRNA-splicing ligase RtcB|nr:RtcB family protein [Reyranella sp.]
MNTYTVDEGQRVPIKMWTAGVPVEASAMQQLRNVASLPFVHRHVAVMPDVHWGMGATVGSVIPTRGAIIPAAVGVDIGCGMAAVRLDGARAEHLPDSLVQLRSELEHTIPVGFGVHKADKWNVNAVAPRLKALERFVADHGHGKLGAGRKDPLSVIAFSQFGSLGGGNHFVELCIDEAGALWLMLHSGSRGIGNMIGLYFIEKAREDMRRHQVNLPDADLGYLSEGTELFDDYVFAVGWAQDYAMGNRQEMLRRALIVLHRHLPSFKERTEVVNCHHNYVVREQHFGDEVWVTRKGAVNAEQGRLGIIPGSMGARSFIVRGKGNPESFHSCSHGAGRAMSRGEAKRRFTVDDHVKATAGIECRKDTGVIDETPGAYKDIDAVMAAQSDLVEVVHTLRQVLCVKG